MAKNIHYLAPQQDEIGLYFRLGHTGYRVLENLHTIGRLPIKRAVIDASHIDAQKDLINCLRESGAELVLDTKVPELACVGSFMTSAKKLPWANKSRPHKPTDFSGPGLRAICDRIAEFAISHKFDVVLCPSHEINGSKDPWFNIDLDTCIALRSALDRKGGQRIQIDFPLLIPYGVFKKEDERKTIIQRISGLPFENLWLRISSFGMSTASASGLIQYIRGALDFRQLGKPLVADGVGGLVGVSLVSFGAVGGICHGVGEKTDFRTSYWRKINSDGGGGSTPRIYLPELDLYLYKDKAQTLLKGHGAKSLLACNDPSCCTNGPQDMLTQYRAHALTQSSRLVDDFNKTPEMNWPDHLTRNHLKPVGRALRKAEKFKLDDSKVSEKIRKQSHRIFLFDQAIDRFSEKMERIPRSLKPILRHIDFPSFGRIG